jgi:serine/threonine protein kinase
LENPVTLQPGARIGSYEIVWPLGAGGMGEVWRAHDSRIDRDVAIKVLPRELAEDADRLARFELEARARASLLNISYVTLADDERDYPYSQWRVNTRLFTVEGLR